MSEATLVARALRRARRAWRDLPMSRDCRSLWRAEHQAWRRPRYEPGRIRLGRYDVAYRDLRTLAPQWRDIFVDGALAFEAGVAAPRILDCGANVGLASLFFTEAYPHARVTAYEADPDLAEVCRRNLRRAGRDVEVVHAAVWTNDGTVAFVGQGGDDGAVVSLGHADGVRREVPAVRLRSLLAREAGSVDLLKLDIECAELAVLADAAPELARVRALLVDLHEFDSGARQTGEVLAVLAGAGFRVSLDRLVPLPWREPVDARCPFPRAALQWASLVRAWRP